MLFNFNLLKFFCDHLQIIGSASIVVTFALLLVLAKYDVVKPREVPISSIFFFWKKTDSLNNNWAFLDLDCTFLVSSPILILEDFIVFDPAPKSFVFIWSFCFLSSSLICSIPKKA